MGRFAMAAKLHQSIAELYESDAANLDEAVQHYQQAADYFGGEESQSCATKCLLKVAEISSLSENYARAVDIYRQVARKSLDNPLLKYSAKEYVFKEVLCHLCVDVLSARYALDRYVVDFPVFEGSREHAFLRNLVDCVEESNLDGFADAVREYDSVSRVDQWCTTMLLRVKKQCSEKTDLR